LFAVPDDLLVRLAEHDPSVPAAIRDAALADKNVQESIDQLREAIKQDMAAEPDIETAEPPAFIKTLISQKVAVRQADFGRFPDTGQLVQINQLPTPAGVMADLQIAEPLTVLLNRQNKDNRVWHGWMMAPEIQYAGFWDLLLEPGDEPFDPQCGMVQLWNPIQLYFPDDFKARVVGRLSAARMLAVRALAEEYLLGDPVLPLSRPGFIALRSTSHDDSVVTGSPLAGNDDPRHRFQQCYHHVAQLLNQPVLAWQTESVSAVNILSVLREAVAAAWQELTGTAVQPQAGVAYAMNHQADDTRAIMAFGDDLQLSLTQTAQGIDLFLRYSGTQQLHVSIIVEGEKARSATLDQNRSTLDYLNLDASADNRVLIDYPDGKHLNLPVTIINP
jgi:hypothetical protein